MAMLVIDLESAPERLRGHLRIWMLEVSAGLYVANVSKRLREEILLEVSGYIEDGTAIAIWPNRNTQGYDLWFAGLRRRRETERDGLRLMEFLPETKSVDDEGDEKAF